MPSQKCIDGSENNIAGFGALPRALDVFENPLNLERAEVGGQRQPGSPADEISPALMLQLRDFLRHASVLPHDCFAQRLAGALVPHDSCFTLIGNPDSCQIRAAEFTLLQRVLDHRFRAAPDLFGIVFHPPRLWIDLLMLLLSGGDNSRGPVENDEARAGGA